MLAEQTLVQIFLHPGSCVLYVYDHVELIFDGKTLLFDKTPQKQSLRQPTMDGKGFKSNYIIISTIILGNIHRLSKTAPRMGIRRRTAHPFVLRIVHRVEKFLHAEEIYMHYTIH